MTENTGKATGLESNADAMNLTHLRTINRLDIRKRKRTGRDARSVPLYGVWSPDGVLLKNFRRLNHAVQWASATKDFLTRKLSR